MIYCLTGQILYVSPLSNTLVLECAGVGYQLTVTTNVLSSLPSPSPSGSYEGKDFRVFTYMAVREDAVELYGFATPKELDCFKLLITVSGVGPKAGMAIMSQFTPDKLALAIATEDTKSISAAPGVGGKTAARVVLELKDKMAKAFPVSAFSTEKPTAPVVHSAKLSDAQEALLVLGYSRQEVASVLKNANLSKSLDQIIRDSLSKLMKT